MERESLVFLAQVAERTERFDEMVDHIKAVAQLPEQLSAEERNLLSVAYKNVVGSRRANWKVIISMEESLDADKLALIQSSKKKIATELEERCSDILEILTKLISDCKSGEDKIFYYKMKGDYHSHVAEVQSGDVRKDVSVANALEAYTSASQIATSDLPPTHPIRLDLALNFSVFYYEILNSPDRACEVAKQALEDATAQLEVISEDEFREASSFLQSLRDYLAMNAPPEDINEDEARKAREEHQALLDFHKGAVDLDE
mmetsp:Transcript_3370/g.5243  ORF Transcript_3370/g.5243 Transcript_3370/m.5243 type:complete len:260 (-) Transcript_3370:1271-2050(-)|eukprot:CAMPEP_0174954832 /NCGR_PEP_ID=MMETSP0004_2-20121128/647_1 /TAXON_ID=420556 /ORGANISM="Ochromonas sp., Strain CCMP1393" /LENGTH=259 /DNA_ID=CAMNT_0016202697 /DNA_START=74 /DNA_END=853 /DNA_ORIENTATION=-